MILISKSIFSGWLAPSSWLGIVFCELIISTLKKFPLILDNLSAKRAIALLDLASPVIFNLGEVAAALELAVVAASATWFSLMSVGVLLAKLS